VKKFALAVYFGAFQGQMSEIDRKCVREPIELAPQIDFKLIPRLIKFGFEVREKSVLAKQHSSRELESCRKGAGGMDLERVV
jgi:hypothetical protein